MTAKELAEKRNKMIADAQALMTGESVNAETRAKVAEMLANADSMKAVIAQAEAEETRSAEQRAKALDLPNPGAAEAALETRSGDKANAAFRSFLQTGIAEKRDLTVTADGVLIPTSVAEPVIAKKSAGQILDVVKVMYTDSGAPVRIPLLNDTGNGFVLNSTAIDINDPVVSSVNLYVDEYRCNPIKLANSLIQDTGFDLVGTVVKAIDQRFRRDLSKYITVGNGSNFVGLTSITAGVTSAAATAVSYEDLVNLMAALDPDYVTGACWQMNTKTLAAVRQIKDTAGHFLFVPYANSAESGFIGSILGQPVRINPYMPDIAAGQVAIQYGNLAEGYTVRIVQPGYVVTRANELYMEKNETGFLAFARIGGAVTDGGTHPIVSLTQKAV